MEPRWRHSEESVVKALVDQQVKPLVEWKQIYSVIFVVWVQANLQLCTVDVLLNLALFVVEVLGVPPMSRLVWV